MTRRTVMPARVKNSFARVQNAAAVSLRSSVRILL
ncbi:hypothetical protein QBC98_007003 [Kitasatospora acidiphila]